MDGSLNRVGIGTDTPAEALDVVGDVRTSGEFIFATEKTYYLSIPALTFRQEDPTDDDIFVVSGGVGYIKTGAAPFDLLLYAPVNLPQGATVTELRFYYHDTAPASDFTLSAWLFTKHNTSQTADSDTWASCVSSGVTAGVQSAFGSPETPLHIYNQGSQYHIRLTWAQDALDIKQKFHGCRIEYTINTLNP